MQVKGLGGRDIFVGLKMEMLGQKRNKLTRMRKTLDGDRQSYRLKLKKGGVKIITLYAWK